MNEEFSKAQIGARLEAMRNSGGTPEERAWAQEFSTTLRSSPEISLADAEHQAWVRVIQSRFEQN